MFTRTGSSWLWSGLVVKSATKLVKVIMITLLNLFAVPQFPTEWQNFPTSVAFLSFSIVSHS